MKLEPKTLVTVFGKHKGIVIAPGKVLPQNPQEWTRVEYRDADTGARINLFVENKNVEVRK